MMLERPGWTPEVIAGLRSEVVEAARWRLFAERLWPAGLVGWLETPELKTPAEIATYKLKARGTVNRIRRILFPKDEPDGT